MLHLWKSFLFGSGNADRVHVAIWPLDEDDSARIVKKSCHNERRTVIDCLFIRSISTIIISLSVYCSRLVEHYDWLSLLSFWQIKPISDTKNKSPLAIVDYQVLIQFSYHLSNFLTREFDASWNISVPDVLYEALMDAVGDEKLGQETDVLLVTGEH